MNANPELRFERSELCGAVRCAFRAANGQSVATLGQKAKVIYVCAQVCNNYSGSNSLHTNRLILYYKTVDVKIDARTFIDRVVGDVVHELKQVVRQRASASLDVVAGAWLVANAVRLVRREEARVLATTALVTLKEPHVQGRLQGAGVEA